MENLTQKTSRLLSQRGTLKLADIAARSGVGLQWLYKFHQGRIPNPGARRVQAVHDYLVSVVK